MENGLPSYFYSQVRPQHTYVMQWTKMALILADLLFLEEISYWKLRILGVSYVITCFKTDLISCCSTVRKWYRQPVTQKITQTSCIPVQPLVPFNIIIIHLCYLSTLFKASYYLVGNIHFISTGFLKQSTIKIMGKSRWRTKLWPLFSHSQVKCFSLR